MSIYGELSDDYKDIARIAIMTFQKFEDDILICDIRKSNPHICYRFHVQITLHWEDPEEFDPNQILM